MAIIGGITGMKYIDELGIEWDSYYDSPSFLEEQE